MSSLQQYFSSLILASLTLVGVSAQAQAHAAATAPVEYNCFQPTTKNLVFDQAHNLAVDLTGAKKMMSIRISEDNQLFIQNEYVDSFRRAYPISKENGKTDLFCLRRDELCIASFGATIQDVASKKTMSVFWVSDDREGSHAEKVYCEEGSGKSLKERVQD